MFTGEQDWLLTVGILATHLVLSLAQFSFLVHLLVRDSEIKERLETTLPVPMTLPMAITDIKLGEIPIPRTSSESSINHEIDIREAASRLARHHFLRQSINIEKTHDTRWAMTTTSLDTYRDKNARKTWFEEYLYVSIVVVYHIIFDIYRLTDAHTFVREDVQDQQGMMLVIFYLMSYAMRMSEDFPTLPTLTDMFFGYLEKKTNGFDVLNIGKGWQSIKYGFCFALRILPPLFLILVNASTYIFADYDYCTDYFVCIYSWEHFFTLPIVLGWVWYFYYDFQRSNLWHWILMTWLLFSAIVIGAIPFLFLPIIIPLTLFLCLFYEFINTNIALFLLSRHQTKLT